MRTVLLAAYYFPPLAGGGVYRPLKFAKYLGQFGWRPVVLTVKSAPYHWASDASLLAELPAGVALVRAPSFEPHRLYAVLSLFRLNALAAWIERVFFIPDDKIGWLPGALWRGYRLIRTYGIDVVLTTGPPHSAHFLGYMLKRWTGCRWVADFRDHWTLNPMGAPRRPALERRWEKTVLTACDRILTVTEGNRKELIETFRLAPGKVRLIPNGYDGEDFEGLPASCPAPDHKLTVVYAGTFYGTRSPEPFLRGLRRLLDRDPGLAGGLRVRFIGKAEDRFLDLIRTLQLEGLVEFLGFLSHREAIEQIVSADALLLVIAPEDGNQNVLTGKVFEYLAAGKPVLALVPEGAASKLLTDARVGVTVAPTDIEAIAEQLHVLYQRHRQHTLAINPDWDVIRRFDRRRLTAQLAEMLNELMS